MSQETVPHTITPLAVVWVVDTSQDESCFHVYRHVLQQKWRLMRRFSNIIMSNFGEPLQIVASVFGLYLTGVTPGGVIWYYSSSVSKFAMCLGNTWQTHVQGTDAHLIFWRPSSLNSRDGSAGNTSRSTVSEILVLERQLCNFN